MMQVSLMNFGGNTRVVNDMNNAAVSIGIGKIVECDIHDVHFHMIRRAVASETLMVVPKEVRMTPKLVAIMDLLRGLDSEPYDELLAAFFKALPPPGVEEGQFRPTRDQIRLALLLASRREVAAALKLQSRVTIHEQGDEVTRKEPEQPTKQPEKAPEVKEPTPPPKPKRARSSAPKRQTPDKAVPKTKVKRERL